jgi:hypothetical protein
VSDFSPRMPLTKTMKKSRVASNDLNNAARCSHRARLEPTALRGGLAGSRCRR